MSFLVRGALRSTVRLAPRRARMYSEEIKPTMVQPTAEWAARQEAVKHHAAGTISVFNIISLANALLEQRRPIFGAKLGAFYAYLPIEFHQRTILFSFYVCLPASSSRLPSITFTFVYQLKLFISTRRWYLCLQRGGEAQSALGAPDRGERRDLASTACIRVLEQAGETFPLGNEQSLLQPEGVHPSHLGCDDPLNCRLQVNKNMEE